MPEPVSLAVYVKRRNGVSLVANGSMTNMLERSFGAGSFSMFWRYWNPIWGYYLSRHVMKPLCRYFPVWLATLMTFAVSGGLHDLAVMLVKWQPTFLFTPWFVLMGVAVLLSKALNISYYGRHWFVRMLLNLAIIAGCLMLALTIEATFVEVKGFIDPKWLVETEMDCIIDEE